MYNLSQVVSGMTKYADNEILSKITGWQKWVIGVGFGVAINKSTNIFNNAKELPIVKQLEVVDSNDNIDIDTIYQELHKQAQKGAITFDVPMIGAMTLTEKDVENLYKYIKES